MNPLPPLCHRRLSALLACLLLTAIASKAAPVLNWSATVDSGAAASDRTKALGVMTTGDVIAVSQIGSGTGAQIRVQRLAASTGSVVWTRDVGSAGFADDATAITIVPASGDAYVAARAATSANGLDWLVFKVSGTDGTLSWANNFTYTTAGNDEPRAITLMPDGNLAVAGMETNPTSGQGRLRVTKIHATTGLQIWNYTSPTDDTDALCVAADGAGNVIAALCSFIFPGLGQLIQGRIFAALLFFVGAGAVWLISLGTMGWVIHVWACVDAAIWKPR